MVKNIRVSLVLVVGILLTIPVVPLPGVSEEVPHAVHRERLLPVPTGLRTQIDFWKAVFATYSTRQVVIHDALHLDRIYEVLDFSPLAESGFSDAEIEAYKREKVEQEKERVRAILMRLHRGVSALSELSPEERKIWALFSDVKQPSKLLDAAAEDRIRSQTGLRERFAGGIEVSRRYLPRMEAIFRHEGVPVELTRLPLIESCFNIRAYSKVGAAGIWQFMPATARQYMKVNRRVDQRRDPLISTRAAAQLLQANYEVLGTWPLAITAYNHGRAGVANAVSTVGSTDIMEIVNHYHGPAFKFASRNFYAEFIAALEVERDFARYFGDLPPSQPDLSPVEAADTVRLQRASLRTTTKPSVASRRLVKHRVTRGQTLVMIAKHYGTTVDAIKRENKLRKLTLRPGQCLRIPKTRKT